LENKRDYVVGPKINFISFPLIAISTVYFILEVQIKLLLYREGNEPPSTSGLCTKPKLHFDLLTLRSSE
jgi:hypothetical protein